MEAAVMKQSRGCYDSVGTEAFLLRQYDLVRSLFKYFQINDVNIWWNIGFIIFLYNCDKYVRINWKDVCGNYC